MRRHNPLLFEADGDFNPGWLLFMWFSALLSLVALGALWVAVHNDKGWPAVVAALSAVISAMLIDAIIVVPIARAKLLAPALKDAARGISEVSQPPFASMDYDERGDEGADA